MASITKRNGKFCVVYPYTDVDGARKQKWETYPTMEEAKRRKAEVEYRQDIDGMEVSKCQTVSELLKEYVSLYGKTIWSLSVYQSNTGLIKNYINPMIGSIKLVDITPRILEKYYQTLQQTPAVPRMNCFGYSGKQEYVAKPTIRKIHNLLRSAFHQAVKWELMEKNPAEIADAPKFESKPREIWDIETLQKATEVCKDERLRICIHLAFACSLRIGELLGLTWDCVDVEKESISNHTASIFINKELQRVEKFAMKDLEKKGVITVFPEVSKKNKTALVLKEPKTATSVRKIFLPVTLAEMLIEWRAKQNEIKEALGSEYQDYNLVIAGPFGTPVEGNRIRKSMQRLIQDNNLPDVVFHSLRHSSITYKLKLNGGDIKAVQGDSGHAQAKMVTDQYSHILDEDRKQNAVLLEEAFYHGKKKAAEPEAEPPVPAQAEANGLSAETIAKLLANPEMVNLLKTLAKTMG